jgi:hypothetical protein
LDTTPVVRRYSTLMVQVVTEPVVAPLQCIECRRTWEQAGERWRLKVLVEEGAPAETVPYCPACHAREFEE